VVKIVGTRPESPGILRYFAATRTVANSKGKRGKSRQERISGIVRQISGSHEVVGSIPTRSTILILYRSIIYSEAPFRVPVVSPSRPIRGTPCSRKCRSIIRPPVQQTLAITLFRWLVPTKPDLGRRSGSSLPFIFFEAHAECWELSQVGSGQNMAPCARSAGFAFVTSRLLGHQCCRPFWDPRSLATTNAKLAA
jgi:hypothetical protein